MSEERSDQLRIGNDNIELKPANEIKKGDTLVDYNGLPYVVLDVAGLENDPDLVLLFINGICHPSPKEALLRVQRAN